MHGRHPFSNRLSKSYSGIHSSTIHRSLMFHHQLAGGRFARVFAISFKSTSSVEQPKNVLDQETDRGVRFAGGLQFRHCCERGGRGVKVSAGALLYVGYEAALRAGRLVRMAGQINSFEPRHADPMTAGCMVAG